MLGVIGYTGELDLLDESQREQSTSFHEKTKYFKFVIGILPTVLGSNWYSNKVKKAATSIDSQIRDSKFLKFIKQNIRQFDYYKEIYANKLNIAGSFLIGGDLAKTGKKNKVAKPKISSKNGRKLFILTLLVYL